MYRQFAIDCCLSVTAVKVQIRLKAYEKVLDGSLPRVVWFPTKRADQSGISIVWQRM